MRDDKRQKELSLALKASSSVAVPFKRIIFVPATRPDANAVPKSAVTGLIKLNDPFTMPLLPVKKGERVITIKAAAPQRELFKEANVQLQWSIVRKTGVGLQNNGNTCFLNSVLQCLTHTPPLVEAVLSQRGGDSGSGVSIAGFDPIGMTQTHFQRAFSAHQPIMPKHAFALRQFNKRFKPGRQEDAHEYLRCLLDAMHESNLRRAGIKPPAPAEIASTTLVNRVFGGSLRSQICCEGIEFESSTYDPFLDLSLEINHAKSVAGALQNFTKQEVLDGANRYRCPKNNKLMRATKRITVDVAPNVLTIHLKRFEFGGYGSKISRPVAFEASLDLAPYMSKPSKHQIYDLYAVLVHSGHSVHSGHYTCYVRAPNGIWHYFDDTRVSTVREKDVFTKQAYILFYIRRTPRTTTVLPAARAASTITALPPPSAPTLASRPQAVENSADAPAVVNKHQQANGLTAAALQKPVTTGTEATVIQPVAQEDGRPRKKAKLRDMSPASAQGQPQLGWSHSSGKTAPSAQMSVGSPAPATLAGGSLHMPQRDLIHSHASTSTHSGVVTPATTGAAHPCHAQPSRLAVSSIIKPLVTGAAGLCCAVSGEGQGAVAAAPGPAPQQVHTSSTDSTADPASEARSGAAQPLKVLRITTPCDGVRLASIGPPSPVRSEQRKHASKVMFLPGTKAAQRLKMVNAIACHKASAGESAHPSNVELQPELPATDTMPAAYMSKRRPHLKTRAAGETFVLEPDVGTSMAGADTAVAAADGGPTPLPASKKQKRQQRVHDAAVKAPGDDRPGPSGRTAEELTMPQHRTVETVEQVLVGDAARRLLAPLAAKSGQYGSGTQVGQWEDADAAILKGAEELQRASMPTGPKRSHWDHEYDLGKVNKTRRKAVATDLGSKFQAFQNNRGGRGGRAGGSGRGRGGGRGGARGWGGGRGYNGSRGGRAGGGHGVGVQSGCGRGRGRFEI